MILLFKYRFYYILVIRIRIRITHQRGPCRRHARRHGGGVGSALIGRCLRLGHGLQQRHEVARRLVPGIFVFPEGIVGKEHVPPVFAVQLEHREIEELGGGGTGGEGWVGVPMSWKA